MPTTSDIVARHVDALSYQHLSRFTGSDFDLARFLSPHSTDAILRRDDFDANALDTTRWTTNAGTGATAFAVPATRLVNGAVSGATGTNATGSNRAVNLYGERTFSGNTNSWLEARFKSSRVSDLKFEVGFVDALTTITTASQVCTDLDTATHTFDAGAGDVAVVAMDPAQTLTTMALATLGSGAVNAGTSIALGTLAPTAATYMRVRLALIGNLALAIVDRTEGQSYIQVGAINGATLVRPWFFIGGGSATTCAVDIDYIVTCQDRA